ncbi:MAG: methyltransferase domain-containing protein [Dehalococcoidia bacterium]|nr:methyltransferase domain-containing protein [Dehalococcoidia bacterium]
MPVKLSRALRNKLSASGVAAAFREYEHRFRMEKRKKSEDGERHYKEVNNLYYDLVTDFYEYGWGKSFHFAPRVPGESFKASLARHEHYLAHVLGLKPGMVVADIGSGIGGPLLEIARFSGTKIVGVNSNARQIERARQLTEEAGLTHLAEYSHCDFLHVEASDESFDAAYSIEATCIAPDKVSVYGEIFRLLKPGGEFGAYEYCLTERFDDQNPHHLKIKANIELWGGLLVIDDYQTVDEALRTVGFEMLETRDLAAQDGPSIPWWQPLAGSGLSLTTIRSSSIGRRATRTLIRALEAAHVAPRGTTRVAEGLNQCATAIAEAGRLGIFTPMYFIRARKPI